MAQVTTGPWTDADTGEGGSAEAEGVALLEKCRGHFCPPPGAPARTLGAAKSAAECLKEVG